MNIFALDKDTKRCAQMHVDKHVVKMILEYCQLLCTTKRLLDNIIEDHPKLYKVTHKNHPSAVWTRKNADCFFWLIELTQELMTEYTHRYGKIHLCEQKGILEYLIENPPSNWESTNSGFCLPTPAMDECFKVGTDVIASYRNYYNKGKRHLHSWKNRQVPDFIEQF